MPPGHTTPPCESLALGQCKHTNNAKDTPLPISNRPDVDMTNTELRCERMQINEEKQREHEVCKRTVLPHCWGISLSPVSFKFTPLPKPKLVPKNFHTNFIWPQWNLAAFNADLHVKTSALLRQEKKKHFQRTFFRMKDVSLTRGLYFIAPALLSTGCGQGVPPPPQSFFSPLQYECGLQRRVTTTI